MRDVSILTDNGVNLEASLELLGDLEFYDETLEAFLEENKTRLASIEKYKNEGNMKDYAILVHALKSDCKYLGFMELADMAYVHELASKANNVDEVNTKYNDLMKLVDKYTEIAKKYLGG